jgi:hypothetical protein
MDTPDKLDLIADEAARRLKSAISEAHADILTTWEQVNDQAQEDEKDPVLTLSFAVKLNLGGNSLVTALTFGVKRKIEEAGEIPDPNQPTLPLGGTVTIETPGMEPVTVTAEKFTRVMKKQGGVA